MSGLGQYLALPVEEYSLLDPTWIEKQVPAQPPLYMSLVLSPFMRSHFLLTISLTHRVFIGST